MYVPLDFFFLVKFVLRPLVSEHVANYLRAAEPCEKKAGPAISEHAAYYLKASEVVGIVNADEVDLPRFHHQKKGHPRAYEEMISDAEDVQWKSVWDLGTFGKTSVPICDVPKGQKILRLMWVYASKPDVNGRLLKIKARIVAVGSSETGDIPWAEAYTPVMNMVTVRVMLVIMIQRKNARAWQYDVESAYCTADSKRELYAHWAPGKCPPQERNTCLRVWKALYGVIDSGRCYYEEWVEYHLLLGFQTIHHDQCYMILVVLKDNEYTAGTQKNDFISFCFHVDDNIVTHIQ